MTVDEPLAVIKVTFDELPEDIKHNIYLFLGAGISCLILTNIMIISKLLHFCYSTFNRNLQRNHNYEQV